MDLSTSSAARDAVTKNRRPPSEPRRVFVSFESHGAVPDDRSTGSLDLVLAPTNDAGKMADWFEDGWWTAVIERWADSNVTVHILPTPGALLHPVTLYQMEMLRRVVPSWRLVGHASVPCHWLDDEIERLAGSAYHEARFSDADQADATVSARRIEGLSVDELFGSIRRAQERLRCTIPVLVRLPSTATDPIQEFARTYHSELSATRGTLQRAD